MLIILQQVNLYVCKKRKQRFPAALGLRGKNHRCVHVTVAPSDLTITLRPVNRPFFPRNRNLTDLRVVHNNSRRFLRQPVPRTIPAITPTKSVLHEVRSDAVRSS
ncbi:hypothetical protein CDAR_479581 [Caerostris darwini]|uniref:Uncharacterized protein n=1 Tax=Caerostris darwini TaxID=1538125 RepID=A0AAV4MW08_9ARAC|nr:hypothetical protein CDAR_479581 [Caerostris darwini]